MCGNYQKVWKSAETILPFSCCPFFSCCPLVFLWEKKTPINITNFGGTPPGVCPVCPMDMSHLSRHMSRLSRRHSAPWIWISTEIGPNVPGVPGTPRIYPWGGASRAFRPPNFFMWFYIVGFFSLHKEKEPAQWQQNVSTIKFALSAFYCHGVSPEKKKKKRLGRFSSLPPVAPPSKTANFIFIVVSPSLKEGRFSLDGASLMHGMHEVDLLARERRISKLVGSRLCRVCAALLAGCRRGLALAFASSRCRRTLCFFPCDLFPWRLACWSLDLFECFLHTFPWSYRICTVKAEIVL